ncbi:NADH:ubiquinone reductase (Na(+)-transporting) subunit B [Crocinitomix algicola]|uniref:NADH:ubiquinone reductase (Na(+)-transporting) subunit B n=1 Tax=Crocinitomix algicola TaxID=1740263 RepID=UPI00082B9A78|nr:NADH:ubiquinone reductase (Na(+)-transporting) subunit B [Crocinitomix algicola]
MKSLEKFMRKIEPTHESKWAKFHPVWDALYTFAFTPGETTKKGAHIRDGIDLKRTMFTVIVALIPCLLFGIYNTGHWHFVAEGTAGEFMDNFGDKLVYGLIQVLPIVIVSYAVGLGVEFIFCIKNQHAIQEGFLVTGMLIPLIVPADIPLWMVAVATIFAVVLGKEVFGGTGMNIVNIALTARAFLFFGYPTKMSGDKVWMSGISDVPKETLDVNGVTGATQLGELATFTGPQEDWTYQGGIKAFESAWSIWDSFVGIIPGSIGETSVIAILIGAALLLYTGIASWKVMTSFVIGGLFVGFLANAFAVNEYMMLQPLNHLVIGGFAFGAVFMITDPVTAAQTSTGKFIYGFLGGALSIVIRVFNGAYPEGVMMAILFMNVMAPMIDHYVIQANIKRRLKRLKTA